MVVAGFHDSPVLLPAGTNEEVAYVYYETFELTNQSSYWSDCECYDNYTGDGTDLSGKSD